MLVCWYEMAVIRGLGLWGWCERSEHATWPNFKGWASWPSFAGPKAQCLGLCARRGRPPWTGPVGLGLKLKGEALMLKGQGLQLRAQCYRAQGLSLRAKPLCLRGRASWAGPLGPAQGWLCLLGPAPSGQVGCDVGCGPNGPFGPGRQCVCLVFIREGRQVQCVCIGQEAWAKGPAPSGQVRVLLAQAGGVPTDLGGVPTGLGEVGCYGSISWVRQVGIGSYIGSSRQILWVEQLLLVEILGRLAGAFGPGWAKSISVGQVGCAGSFIGFVTVQYSGPILFARVTTCNTRKSWAMLCAIFTGHTFYGPREFIFLNIWADRAILFGQATIFVKKILFSHVKATISTPIS